MKKQTPETLATNLRLIEEMAGRLEARAIDRANDRALPGGDALVNLACVGSLADWIRRNELREEAGLDPDTSSEDPDDLWPPLQMLWFWSESTRAALGMDHDDPRWRPTLVSEAAFLRHRDVAEWLRANEVKWDDYAGDVERARSKLESVLIEGTRVAFRGVECLYDECRGARPIRMTVPTRGKDGRKTYRLTDWFCPRCHRTWSERDYTSRIYANVESTHWSMLADDMWCTSDRAARTVARPEGTVRSWMSRGQVATVCLLDEKLGRPTMVLLDDVRDRDRLAKERRAQWLETRKRRRALGHGGV